MQTLDYIRELRSARAEIKRAAMLLESGRERDAENAGAAIECATLYLARIRDGSASFVSTASFKREFSVLQGELENVHALMDNALAFFGGWSRLAVLSAAAYTPNGNLQEFAIPRSLSVEG
jgi:hypothetical protein